MVAYHKPWPKVNNSIYMPIHVGKNRSSLDLGMQGDNEGENISQKNSLYCEMTAIYWGWKNLDADYYGLFHYRRFMTFSKKENSFRRKIKCIYHRFIDPTKLHVLIPQIPVSNSENFVSQSEVFANELGKLFEKREYDAVFPKPVLFSIGSVKNYFCHIGWHYIKALEDVTREYAPDLYKYLRKTLDGTELYAANMFIMKRDIFFNYCETIFPILEEVVDYFEKEHWCVDIYGEKCSSRFVGYLSELLTSSYCLKLINEKKQILHLDVLFVN